MLGLGNVIIYDDRVEPKKKTKQLCLSLKMLPCSLYWGNNEIKTYKIGLIYKMPEEKRTALKTFLCGHI